MSGKRADRCDPVRSSQASLRSSLKSVLVAVSRRAGRGPAEPVMFVNVEFRTALNGGVRDRSCSCLWRRLQAPWLGSVATLTSPVVISAG
jgi:hypothetical protein